MTEYAQDVLVDRIVDRCEVEFFKYGHKDIEVLTVAKRYKAFREAPETEQADILKSSEVVFKLMKSILPLNLRIDILC